MLNRFYAWKWATRRRWNAVRLIVHQQLRKWLPRTALLLAGVALAAFAIEILFRASGRFALNRFLMETPDFVGASSRYRPSPFAGLGWEIDPRAAGTDENTRNRCEQSPLPEKAPGVFRIVTIGDSITEQGIYQRQLEDRLNRGGQRARFEVWNCGVGGYSLYQYVHYARRRALPCRPDALLVGLELYDLKEHPVLLESDGVVIGFRNRRVESDFRVNKFLYLHSSAYRAIRSVSLDYREPGNLSRADARKAMDELLQMGRSEGVPVLFLVWPRLKKVYSDDERQCYRELLGVLRHAKAEFVDLHDSFVERDDPAFRWRSADDTHPSRRGFEAMSEDIFRFVSRRISPAEPAP
jgi:hypothetical protein